MPLGVVGDIAKTDTVEALLQRHVLDQDLDQVWFVRDYLRLHFTGAWLDVLFPELLCVQTADQSVRRWAEPGFRDALCERIDARVVRITHDPDHELRLQLSDGSAISASLDPARYDAPEVAVFMSETGTEPEEWVAFTPGLR